MSDATFHDLPIVPLGAGDLIDRAVRLYRRHLLVLMRIAAPPVFVSAVGSVVTTIAWRNIFDTGSGSDLALYVLLLTGGLIIIVAGHIFSLLVMGGASRNLVMHLLWNERVTARTTYAAVRSRFWSLLGASFLIMFWLSISVFLAFMGWYLVSIFVGLGAVLLGKAAPVWFAVVVGVIGVTAATAVAVGLFFFLVGRVAYVPQVMLVEGKGIWDSLGRSFTLASGNVRRLMAMTLFIVFVTNSALMILVIPLGWYGFLNGVDPSPWNSTQWPMWYAMAYSILEPLSKIILAPVWMLGLSLLYVDERVRHEGYDIELMASQRLEPMPQMDFKSPMAPAISKSTAPPSMPPPPLRSGGILGLR
jgi:hypothetical protein